MSGEAAGEFDAAGAVKRLLREARTGALATLEADGHPYASLVQVATLPDGSPVLLLSGLARHTSNLKGDPRVSLMLDERRLGDELQGSRVSLKGRIATAPDQELARRRFLARHPDATGFAGFRDFAFYAITLESAHLVAGFGRILDLDAEELLTALDGADELIAAEESAIAHMNADHADAIALYATALLGAPAGAWRLTGLDPEGCDLMSGELARRLDFGRRVASGAELRAVLVELASTARQTAA